MPLKAIHDSQDEIPEEYQSLYTEKNGKFELTGIQGVKTAADIERVQTALTKEREDHKTTKESLGAWGDLKHDEVVQQLDRIPELEAKAEGKLDDAKIDEIAQRRADSVLKSKLAPLERELSSVKKERDEAVAKVTELGGKISTRSIHDQLREVLVSEKVRTEAHEDALMWGENIFEINEDGKAITKESSPFGAGLSPSEWLIEIADKRPHWWGESRGGGAQPGGKGGGSMANNPWSAEHWNMTKQGEVIRQKGMDHAKKVAEAAGSKVGAPRPPAKK